MRKFDQNRPNFSRKSKSCVGPGWTTFKIRSRWRFILTFSSSTNFYGDWHRNFNLHLINLQQSDILSKNHFFSNLKIFYFKILNDFCFKTDRDVFSRKLDFFSENHHFWTELRSNERLSPSFYIMIYYEFILLWLIWTFGH